MLWNAIQHVSAELRRKYLNRLLEKHSLQTLSLPASGAAATQGFETKTWRLILFERNLFCLHGAPDCSSEQ